MGIRKGFRESTVPVIVAFAILVPANVVSWVAFTTVYWAYLDVNHKNYQDHWLGLWRLCPSPENCVLQDSTSSEWFAAFQAFGVFGFAGLNVALFLVIMYMFVEWCNKNVELRAAAIASCFVGAVGYIIAVVVFSQKIGGMKERFLESPLWKFVDVKLGFSLWLAVAPIILAAVSGAVLVVDWLIARRKASKLNIVGNSRRSDSDSNNLSLKMSDTSYSNSAEGSAKPLSEQSQKN